MRKPGMIVWALLAGMLMGVLLPNLNDTAADYMGIASNLAILNQYMKEGTQPGDFFFYLLKYRGMAYLLTAALGLSIFGVPVSIVSMAAMGTLMCGTLTSLLIQGGITGFMLGIAFLFPHYLLYIPVSVRFYSVCSEMSLLQWKGSSGEKGIYRRYVIYICLLFLVLIVGMLLESYVNPVLLQVISKKFQIF